MTSRWLGSHERQWEGHDRRCCCLQSKEEIAQDVKEQLEKSMTAFGFSIIQTLVSCQERLEIIDSLFAMIFKRHLGIYCDLQHI